jgi:NAD(P)-dependent dehydrogenase (short-subunit alcohol dehydrogenase family)
VYVTGRSTRDRRSEMDRPETIEETAALVDAAGGRGIPVVVDHLEVDQVQALVARMEQEQGRLDLLVNDVWGGDDLTEWDTPLWKHSLVNGLHLLRLAIDTHIITSHEALPLLLRRPGGLVVEITDGSESNTEYRGSFFYDLAKASVIRMALALAEELRPHGATAVALTPGWLRSEAMLDRFGVTEQTWPQAVTGSPHFAMSETPAYIGRAVVALAGDPEVARWSGRSLSSGQLAREYGFTDVDGTQPDWARYYNEVMVPERPADPTGYR